MLADSGHVSLTGALEYLIYSTNVRARTIRERMPAYLPPEWAEQPQSLCDNAQAYCARMGPPASD